MLIKTFIATNRGISYFISVRFIFPIFCVFLMSKIYCFDQLIREWTPKLLIEEFQDSQHIVDPNNFLNLDNHPHEYEEMQSYINSLENSGYTIIVYVINSISKEDYYSPYFTNFYFINSKKFLLDLQKILTEKYHLQQQNLIIAVFSIKDKLVDFIKDESFFLGMNTKAKYTLINFSNNYLYNINFKNDEEKYLNYIKAVKIFLNNIEKAFSTPYLTVEIKLFALFITGLAFYKLWITFRLIFHMIEEEENLANHMMLSDINYYNYYNLRIFLLRENLLHSRNSNQNFMRIDFDPNLSLTTIDPMTASNFTTSTNNLFNLNNSNMNFQTYMNLVNLNGNVNINNHNYNINNNTQHFLILQNYNFNNNTYQQNIDKIKILDKNKKINRQKYIQNTCVICLEEFKNNKNKSSLGIIPKSNLCLLNEFNANNLRINNNLSSRHITIENNLILQNKSKSNRNLNVNKFKRLHSIKDMDVKAKRPYCEKNLFFSKNEFKKLFYDGRRSLRNNFVKTDENPLHILNDKGNNNIYSVIDIVKQTLKTQNFLFFKI